jgi:hypothetical protein
MSIFQLARRVKCKNGQEVFRPLPMPVTAVVAITASYVAYSLAAVNLRSQV